MNRLKARLDFHALTLQRPEFSQQLTNRGHDPTHLQRLLEAKETRSQRLHEVELLVHRRRKGDANIERYELQQAKLRADEAEQVFEKLAMGLPNWTDPRSPIGEEKEAKVLKAVLPSSSSIGEVPKVKLPHWRSAEDDDDVKPLDHLKLAERGGWIDFTSGAVTSGSKFAFLKGPLARLEVGLQNLMLKRLERVGFIPVATPDVVRSEFIEACGFQPRGENTQVYYLENSDLCLVGTSEIPLAGSLCGARIKETVKLAGFGHCFRTEAGAPGAASKGLYRLHQFTKVEMFVACASSQSENIHSELLNLVTEWCDELGLVWRALDMPTEELGASAYRKFDVEVWMPGLARWGEVASITNCTDFQSRRLDIKTEKKSASPDHNASEYVHTLNGTACAIPRMLVALMETHQTKDGKIKLPPVVAEAVGFAEF